MLVCIGIIFGAALLFGVSSSAQLPRDMEPPRGRRIFWRGAYYLLRRFQKMRGNRKITAFAVGRLADVLLVVFVGAGGSLLLQAAVMGTTLLIDGYGISRPADGEGEVSRELQVQIGENGQTEQMEIVVSERRYTQEEKTQFLEQALSEIEPAILGENASADEVRGRIFLPDKLADGKVDVVWSQEPAGLLDADGYLSEDLPESGEVLQLRAVLSCDGLERIYECALCVYPPDYSEEEQLRRALADEVEKADELSAEKSVLTLPREMNGQKLVWQEPKVSVTGACLMLTCAAAVFVWIGKDQEIQKKEELRRRQMTMDYPDLLLKLSMLLSAGLTMQNAFFKIALEYRDREDQEVRFAYEEMLKACYEMRSGVSETRAYENFGKRCGGNGYIKLGSMLSSNLQKGAEGLAGLLQEEAQRSMEERRQTAKKLGEEAGTKLLMPMVLMLVVVLVILLVPAMLAF